MSAVTRRESSQGRRAGNQQSRCAPRVQKKRALAIRNHGESNSIVREHGLHGLDGFSRIFVSVRIRVIRVIRVLSEMLIDSNMPRSNLHEFTRPARPHASYLPLGHVRSIITHRGLHKKTSSGKFNPQICAD
jgi:hypothetical protein